jgi:hypothetical protein
MVVRSSNRQLTPESSIIFMQDSAMVSTGQQDNCRMQGYLFQSYEDDNERIHIGHIGGTEKKAVRQGLQATAGRTPERAS